MTELRFLWLELTGKCQLSCSHCYADSGPAGAHGSMAVGDWRRVLDQAAELGIGMVQFIGGEPTLHPHLPELLEYALARRMDVEVFSNLAHVTPSMWELFSLPGVRLACSYYSDDPAQHAAITRRRGAHARTRANIAEAVRRRIPLRVGVIDLADGQRWRQAIAELEALGVDADTIGTDRLREVGRGAHTTGPSPEQLCGHCTQGVAAVLPSGDVLPCAFSRWLACGNVHEQDLAEILPAGLADRRAELDEVFAARHNDQAEGCGPRCGPNCEPIGCGPRCTPMVSPCKPRECLPVGDFCPPNYQPGRPCSPRTQTCPPTRCQPYDRCNPESRRRRT